MLLQALYSVSLEADGVTQLPSPYGEGQALLLLVGMV